MYKVKIFSTGKNKEAWLLEAIEEYSKRLKKFLSIEWILAKNDQQMEQLLEKQGDFIALDPNGHSFSSEAFSNIIVKKFNEQGCRLVFVIGGPDGLSSSLKARASLLLSLSKMTFTHQITRLVLLEQLYRALEIDKGSPYHK